MQSCPVGIKKHHSLSIPCLHLSKQIKSQIQHQRHNLQHNQLLLLQCLAAEGKQVLTAIQTCHTSSHRHLWIGQGYQMSKQQSCVTKAKVLVHFTRWSPTHFTIGAPPASPWHQQQKAQSPASTSLRGDCLQQQQCARQSKPHQHICC